MTPRGSAPFLQVSDMCLVLLVLKRIWPQITCVSIEILQCTVRRYYYRVHVAAKSELSQYIHEASTWLDRNNYTNWYLFSASCEIARTVHDSEVS